MTAGTDPTIWDQIDPAATGNGHAAPTPDPEPEPAPKQRARPKPAPAPALEQPMADLAAEENLLGAILLSGSYGPEASRIIVDQLATILDDGAGFYRTSHRRIYQAAIAVTGRGEPAETGAIVQQLHQTGGFVDGLTPDRVYELAASANAISNAPHYANRVAAVHQRRRRRTLLQTALTANQTGDLDPTILDQLRTLADQPDRDTTNTLRIRTPEEFVASGVEAPPLWGEGDQVLAAAGETTLLCGPQGVGKSTIAQRYALCRAGHGTDLLGHPVRPAPGKVLYVAADRPRQAARSLGRMLKGMSPDQLHQLAERLVFWEGPLPFNVLTHPRSLTDFARFHQASDLILDSLKDVAASLHDPDVGSRLNLAFQETLANSIDIFANHHQRKGQVGNSKPRSIDDVYGAGQITWGAGSVLLLWGKPGDTVVDLDHLKQPAEEVGPLKIVHDHVHGNVQVQDTIDLLEIIARSNTTGMTVNEAASLLYGTTDPDANKIEKARRRLERWIRDGTLSKYEPGAPAPTRYHLRYEG